jgi:putative ATP-binding cassette transporter
MQTIGAFGQVQESLSFFVQSYTQISEWCAVVERLAGFDEALEHVRARGTVGGGIQLAGGSEPKIRLKNVDLELPDGRPLIGNINLSIFPGDTVLLAGNSGTGKSTLLRAIAGIWPFGKGQIFSTPNTRVLFLPQNPYLPIGTLREVVSYPMATNGVDDAILCEALTAVGLPNLAGRLDESAHWTLQLSPGEQQRIAFARALVQKPECLFLDEATSAIDEASEVRLYSLLRERLAGTTIFSVGHRATLRPFHARRLLVQRNANGPGSIIEVIPTTMSRVNGAVHTPAGPAALAS